jgi:uncharacterized protein (DUF1800 family)
MGYQAYLDYQLDYESIDDSALDAILAPYDILNMTAHEIFLAYGMAGARDQLSEVTTLRSVFSARQLYERMVEFWTDHFNIDNQSVPLSIVKLIDDRDVIRRYALTTFPQLLIASAHSAAMLLYLNNDTNVAGRAQENFARESMELHTLGVDGPYDQVDVEEVARCFTGWSFVISTANVDYGEFQFVSAHHDDGEKTVLGVVIPANGGESDGDTVLDLLATNVSTARFIATKLCKWFLGYDPPLEIIESVKSTYLNTGGDIKSMLRDILQPDVLSGLATAKYKRPFHLLTSLFRATQAAPGDMAVIRDSLKRMGHLPFAWPAPDGYPDKLDAWGKAVLPRWEFTSQLFDNELIGTTVDVLGLIASEGGDVPGQEAQAINRVLTGGILPSDEVVLVQQFINEVSGTDVEVIRDAFALMASLPGYQWY